MFRILTTGKKALHLTVKLKHAPSGHYGKINGLEQSKRSGFEIVKFLLQNTFSKQPISGKILVAGSLTCLIGSKLLNVQIPQYFKKAIDAFHDIEKEKLKNLNLTESQQADAARILLLSTVALGLIVAFGVCRLTAEALDQLRNALFATVAQKSIRRLSKDLFRKIHELPMSWHLSKQTGMVSKAIDRGTRGATQIVKASVFNVFPTMFEMALVCAILNAQCGPQFAGVALGTVGIYSGFTVAVTNWRTKFRVQMNRADNQAGNLAVDSLTNFETVKLFNNEKFEEDRYDVQLAKYEAANLKIEWSLAALNYGQQVIITGGMFSLMYMCGMGILDGTMTAGTLVMVNGLLFQLSRPLGFLGSVYRDMNQSLTDLKTMMALMELDTQKDKPNAVDAKTVIPVNSQPKIEFKDIEFNYDESNRIFEKISFSVAAGKKVAIVGGSGSGKSTIVRLLYRLYEPKNGDILINDVSIKDMTRASVRERIGIVPQDCVLFHDTIEHNIKYGDLECSQQEMLEAAKTADLHESILKMKNGYQTVVGERGLKLSGGEKQRLAIARAMMKKPDIIVYDEATSSLDSITEQNILAALNKITENRTTIVIAHRLSTVMHCDEIIVLGNGKVLEQGTHTELLNNENSEYSKLWKSQHQAVL